MVYIKTSKIINFCPLTNMVFAPFTQLLPVVHNMQLTPSSQPSGLLTGLVFFSLACISSKTHNLQVVLFSSYLVYKSTVVVPGVPNGDLGNWE